MWKVWVFLAPLCPICQDYTFYLNTLHEQWELEYPGQIELIGWFPNPTATDEQIALFAERYAVDWSLAPDTVGWSDAVGAKWTPEAFLVDPNGQVRYRGRVNDLYYALGKHRPKPKKQDLALAVQQAMSGQAIAPSRTYAIGCPIERRYDHQDSLARTIISSGVRGL